MSGPYCPFLLTVTLSLQNIEEDKLTLIESTFSTFIFVFLQENTYTFSKLVKKMNPTQIQIFLQKKLFLSDLVIQLVNLFVFT